MEGLQSLCTVPPHQGQMEILSICDILLHGPVLGPLANQVPLRCFYASYAALSPQGFLAPRPLLGFEGNSQALTAIAQV